MSDEDKEDNKNDDVKIRSINPRIISSEPTVDTTGWGKERLMEYQKVIETNRIEAEKTYDLACTQLNSFLAISGVILSITIGIGLSVGDSSSFIFVISSFLIGCSVILAAYTSMKSMNITASHNYYSLSLITSTNTEELICASINGDLAIAKSHTDATNYKRMWLNVALTFFILGVVVMMVAIFIHFYLNISSGL